MGFSTSCASRVQRSAPFKDNMIHLDFETRSTCNIWDAGAWVYSQHFSTEILCMAYAIDDGPVKIVTYDQFINIIHFGIPCDDLIQAIQDGSLLCAHNALFEQSIWKNILVPVYGFPRVPINRFRCTMAKALARSLPRSLKDVGKALNAPILKSDEGYRTMIKLCKPKPDGTWHESEEDMQKLYDYCIQDVEAERCIDQMLPDLIPTEQNIWFLDQLINQRGIYVDRDAIQTAIRISESYSTSVKGIVEDVSAGKLDGVSRRMAVLEWCRDQGVVINGYTKGEVTSVLGDPNLPEAVRTVLEAKLQLGKTSITKYSAMLESCSDDNHIRDLFIYHGASTGRWAGKLIQIHNLPKGKIKDTDTAIDIMKQSTPEEFEIFYPDVMDALSSCIRGMIIAAPGHQLMVADYAAIEARVVLWLAGEEYGLKQFRDFDAGIGQEPYVAMAQSIYNRPDIGAKSIERQLGKTAILGCGFGMGDTKFLSTCHAWGIKITADLAKKSVETYRSIYPRVRNSWFAQEAAAIKAVQNPNESINCGRVQWQSSGDALLCRLPSGRFLVYNNPSLDYVITPWGESKLALHFMGVNGVTKKWEREHTYGGKLVENITQAVARDIMATAMFRAEKAGYSVAFSVHDEIVSEVQSGFGDIKTFEEILCHLPVWCQDCPITAKGFVTERYRKD